MSKLCFFYGTLKTGHYNHEHFKHGCKFISAAVVGGYSLVQANSSYPHAIVDPKGFIMGEIHEVDERTLYAIDHMELGAGYLQQEVTTDCGEVCTMYVADSEHLRSLPRFSFFEKKY